MSASPNPPLMSIMNSPLLRQHQEKATEQTPAPTTPPVASAPAAVVSPAVAVSASATSVAPYGFDPAGPTPPLVPVRGAEMPAASSSVSAPAAVVSPAVSAFSGVSAVGMPSSSGAPVIPAHLLQFWADVETIQEQVSNSLSLEEEMMSGMSLQDQQAKTRAMILQALDAYTTTLVNVDGDRDRWTDEYNEKVQQAVFDHIYRLGRLQPLIDTPEVENIHIVGDRKSVV